MEEISNKITILIYSVQTAIKNHLIKIKINCDGVDKSTTRHFPIRGIPSKYLSSPLHHNDLMT